MTLAALTALIALPTLIIMIESLTIYVLTALMTACTAEPPLLTAECSENFIPPLKSDMIHHFIISISRALHVTAVISACDFDITITTLHSHLYNSVQTTRPCKTRMTRSHKLYFFVCEQTH